jgi:transcriptional regulator with XRE-family HTH domain
MELEYLQKSLGEVCRTVRERQGLTQAQVAKQACLAPEIYGRIERGGMMPSVPTLRKLSLILGISTDVLLELNRADVAPSLEAPTPEGNLSPELRQLVRMLRGWSSARVKRLIRVAKVLESPSDE